MVRAILVGIALLFAVGTALAADQSLNGYYRKDGTYVQPYYRSTPNNSLYDNYSSKGIMNPWTGERGSERNEYSTPPVYNQSSPFYTPPQTAPLYDSNPPKRR